MPAGAGYCGAGCFSQRLEPWRHVGHVGLAESDERALDREKGPREREAVAGLGLSFRRAFSRSQATFGRRWSAPRTNALVVHLDAASSVPSKPTWFVLLRDRSHLDRSRQHTHELAPLQ